ncbi:unnamed protein product [Chrysoparadoxa australica]
MNLFETRVLTTELADMELDSLGILTLKTKPVELTENNICETFDLVKQTTNGKKLPILVDNSLSAPYDSKLNNLMEEQVNQIATGIAVLSNSTVSLLIVKVFLSLKKTPVPIKIFKSRKNAMSWLRSNELQMLN